MPTAAERQALFFLAAVAALGGVGRAVGARRFAAELGAGERLVGGPTAASLGERALAAQIVAVDSAQSSRRTARGGRPTGRSSRAESRAPWAPATASSAQESEAAKRPVMVNLNQSTLRELERLPRVGPALAQRIVAWREANGPFRSLDDLRHVRGIGPVTAALLAPSVTF